MTQPSVPVQQHFDRLAHEYEGWKEKSAYYYRAVMRLLREFVPEGSRVLELGCGTGAILDSFKPSYGLGIDLSPEMIAFAKKKRPHLHFETGDICNFTLAHAFDFAVMVDLVEHVPDLLGCFTHLAKVLPPETLVLCSSANPLWAPVLHWAEKFQMKMPEGPHRWPGVAELRDLIEGAGFKIVDIRRDLVFPKYIPLFSDPLNRLFPKSGPLARLNLIQLIAFRKN